MRWASGRQIEKRADGAAGLRAGAHPSTWPSSTSTVMTAAVIDGDDTPSLAGRKETGRRRDGAVCGQRHAERDQGEHQWRAFSDAQPR
jgi:hypothetical protein